MTEIMDLMEQHEERCWNERLTVKKLRELLADFPDDMTIMTHANNHTSGTPSWSHGQIKCKRSNAYWAGAVCLIGNFED